MSVQYLGALRRAAEKAAENARRKQKVFLVPPGEVENGMFPELTKKNGVGLWDEN